MSKSVQEVKSGYLVNLLRLASRPNHYLDQSYFLFVNVYVTWQAKSLIRNIRSKNLPDNIQLNQCKPPFAVGASLNKNSNTDNKRWSDRTKYCLFWHVQHYQVCHVVLQRFDNI